MNVLELISAVTYEENVTGATPSTVVSPTDPNTLQLVNLFYATGRDLVKRKCWPTLKRHHTFNTGAGETNPITNVSAFALPTDYYCSLLDTFWDTTNNRKLLGPAGDDEFMYQLYGLANGLGGEMFRIFGRKGDNQFQITPDPGTTNIDIAFEYISDAWIRTGASTWGKTITLDADIVAFDDDVMIEGLTWRWNKKKGLDYEEDMKRFYRYTVDPAVARWQGMRKTILGGMTDYLLGLNIQSGSWNV